MIVDENDRSGIEFERAPEDCPGIDRKLRKGSVLELLVSEEPPCPVEEQYAQHLDRKRTHRRDQILAQLRVEGVDHLGAKVAPHPLDHHVARADQDRTSVVEGKSVSVRVDLGGRRSIKKTS